jgi:predicted ATPase
MTDDGRADMLAEADSFVGRQQELSDLAQLAASARAITLCGPAGIGKTRLLRRLVTGLAPGFGDGAFLASLGDLRQPDLVAPRLAAILGVSEEPGIPPADTLTAALRGRRLLIALDHCDHVAGACADLAERLLAAAPGLLVITTCRQALGLAAESAWPVPPLAVPPPGADRPGPARDYDAVRLFAERAAPGFVLDRRTSPAVAGLCRVLGGLPLAVELAAARTAELPADEVAARLGDWCRMLGDPALPLPQRTLQATIDWSHDRLSPAEQALLRRLSVFAGWSLELAERVCADDDLPATWILSLLTALAGRGLITAEPGPPNQGRYRMPDAIREYAAGQLARSGETTALRRRLRDYALAVSEYFFSIGLATVPAPWAARIEVFQRYETDADNIRTALAWCLFHGDIETGLRLCTAFGPCWIVLGGRAESAGWFGAFLAADQSQVTAAVRGPALTAGAYHALAGGDPRRAGRWAAEGLELCRADGNLRFMSAALNLLAQAALLGGRPQEALQYGDEAVAAGRKCADKWNEGYALGSFAAAQAALGQLGEARTSAEAALAMLLEIDHQWGAARIALGLAELCRALGDLAAARDHYLRALALLRQVKGDPEITRCLAGLGRLALDSGDLPQARADLADGLRVSLETGSRAGISRSLLAFAALAAREGRPDTAVQLAAAVTVLGEPAPVPPARVQRYLDAAAGLGPAEVARLWAAGLRLTAAAAAELALVPPGRHELRSDRPGASV